MKHYIYFILLLLCLSSNNTFAQTLSSELNLLFEQGKALYVNKQFAEASQHFNQLIEVGEKKKDPYKLAQIYYQLGVFYDGKKIQTKALKFLFEGINILSKSPSETTPNAFFVQNKSSNKRWGIAYPTEELRALGAQLLCDFYNRIAGAYYNQQDYTKAEKYWETLLIISQVNNNRKATSSALNNLGEIQRINNQDQKALLFYLIHHRVKNNLQVITSLLSLQEITQKYLDKKTSTK